MLHEIPALLFEYACNGLLAKVVQLVALLVVNETEGTAKFRIIELNLDLVGSRSNLHPAIVDFLLDGLLAPELLSFLGLEDKMRRICAWFKGRGDLLL